jgi:hypothetical protein
MVKLVKIGKSGMSVEKQKVGTNYCKFTNFYKFFYRFLLKLTKMCGSKPIKLTVYTNFTVYVSPSK